MPRGGTCNDCNKYVLWGDVVRGCYRRARGGLEQPVSENEMDEEEGSANTGGELSMRLDALRINDPPQLEPEPGQQPRPVSPPTKPAKKPKAKVAPKLKAAPKPKRVTKKTQEVSSDVEDFAAEMDAVDYTTEESGDNLPAARPQARTGKADSVVPKAPKTSKKKQANPVPSDAQTTTTATKTTTKKAQPRKPTIPNQNSDSNLDEIVRRVLGELSLSSPEIAPISAPKKSRAAAKPAAEITIDPTPKAPKTKVRPRMKVAPILPESTPELPPIVPATKTSRSKKAKWVDISDDEAGGTPSHEAHATTAVRISSAERTKSRKRRSPSPEYIDLCGI